MGSTIYPGMQFTAVYLKRYVFGDNMSLNDVCCYIPAWFGVMATILVGCIAYEASLSQNSGGSLFGVMYDGLLGRYADVKRMTGGSRKRIMGFDSPAVECAVFAMGFMGVVPAHLMRSVGGGYDNESVAVTAMTLTFFLWMRSLRNGDKNSHFIGILAGVAYFNMVSCCIIFNCILSKSCYNLPLVMGTVAGCRVGWIHLRVELDWSTCCLFGIVRTFLYKGLFGIYVLLYRWNIVGHSGSCCGMVTSQVIGAVGTMCCFPWISGVAVL